jgi:hypothetical protein
MIDVELQTRLIVHNEGTAGPYLMVPVQQLPQVEQVLRGADIPFHTSRDAVQLDGHDAIAVVDFGRFADAEAIQVILDAH